MDAHGPFTGVVRFVHTHVICKDKGMSGPSAESQGKVMCTYEHAEIVESSTATFPLTGENIGTRSNHGVCWQTSESFMCQGTRT